MAELGETRVPDDLVPGDAAAIDENVVAIRGRGQAMENAANGLKQIDSGAWVGAAGDAFREKFTYEPARWYGAGDAFETTAASLESYASILRWAQSQAAEAIELWDQGEAATRRAKSQHETAVAQANAQNQANAANGSGMVVQVAPFSDPGEAQRQAAREILARARQQLTEAGDRAASAIRTEGDRAPSQSAWDAAWDGVGNAFGFVGDVGLGLWDGFTGTLDFVWQLSPTHLIENPDHYGELWDGVTKAASFAVNQPVEFGKQMVNWDQWSKEPGRALGATAFGFIPVAGVLAKMRKFRKLADDVPDPNAPAVKPKLGDYFPGDSKPKASQLDHYAEAQGWQKQQSVNGPPKYVDDNGVVRMTIKQGSDRAPGSENPHVEIRDENGQRTDPHGNPVTRKSPGNHTPIEWDW